MDSPADTPRSTLPQCAPEGTASESGSARGDREATAGNGRAALRASGIVVDLDGARILREASLEVAAGEIHALIGPNGAGKTTLANVLTGHVVPLAGTVELDGAPLTGPTWSRIRKGVGRKFQIPRVFPRASAEENLNLASPQADAEGSELDISEIRYVRGDALSHGWRQRLEMLMVAAQAPRIAVLDEPTAGMTRSERSELAELILAHRGRVTYLIVEHDMDFVQRIADRVSFMHEGQVMATGTFAEIEANPTVRQIYLGEGVGADAPSAVGTATEPTVDAAVGTDAAGSAGTASVALSVEHLTVFRGPLPAARDVAFDVRTGGSIGILGRNGAGKSTLLGGLVGVLPSHGRVVLQSVDVSLTPAWKRARLGLALVPQGRGLLPNMSVDENLQLAELEEPGTGPHFDVHEMFPALRKLIRRKAGLCSGGEQQQLAIARALLRRPTVLLLDEPTEGLAPIVITEITHVLKYLSTKGLTLVLAEQHHHIVSELCEQFVVLRGGEVAGQAATTPEAIARHYSSL
jgi:ABC-type branched-subunit amino acid transport system ATPase component